MQARAVHCRSQDSGSHVPQNLSHRRLPCRCQPLRDKIGNIRNRYLRARCNGFPRLWVVLYFTAPDAPLRQVHLREWCAGGHFSARLRSGGPKHRCSCCNTTSTSQAVRSYVNKLTMDSCQRRTINIMVRRTRGEMVPISNCSGSLGSDAHLLRQPGFCLVAPAAARVAAFASLLPLVLLGLPVAAAAGCAGRCHHAQLLHLELASSSLRNVREWRQSSRDICMHATTQKWNQLNP